ncbi:unnamed protein product, partial [Closterium sp. NIES-53]
MTLSPQQLREWAVWWGSHDGGAFGTSVGGVEAPGGVEATSLGACDSASTCAEPEEALHTILLNSDTSHCFFRDCTTVTLLKAPVPVTLADPFGGPVVARSSTVLPCPAAPSGSLKGFHLPSFARNLVATAAQQDQFVTVTQPRGELVAICMDPRTGEHLATFTRRPGYGLYTLTTESAQVAELGQTLLWHHRLGHPSFPACVTCTSVSLCLASPGPYPRSQDQSGEFCSRVLEDFCGAEGIAQSFAPLSSSQKNRIVERCIGLVMEVARTSIIHAAAPHFLWPFAVRYATEQLNLWPRVSHPETSPTLHVNWPCGRLLVLRLR